jgi:uncharacterized membrane protein YvbJ
MFCAQCGANNADNAIVCMQCGKDLRVGTPVPMQATGVVMPPPGTTVPNYLVFAILATVFCCLPTGIAAIVYAAQVNGKLQVRDYAGAQLASKNAKMWCLISLGVGLVVGVIYMLMIMVGVIGSMHQH